jgi:elongation factor Ts
MYKITIKQINELRERTGFGIMDCKKSLILYNGNIEKAIDFIRSRGKKIYYKKFDNYNGILITKLNKEKNKGVILGITCQTDFVSKNSNFINLVDECSKHSLDCYNKDQLLNTHINSLTIKEKLIEQSAILGEKLNLSVFEILEAPFVYSYTHHNNKLASLIGLSKRFPELGKNLSMQVAAMDPIALTKEEIPISIITREKEIIKTKICNINSTNNNIINKILNNKLNNFYNEKVLLYQSFIKDNKITVYEYINQFDVTITSYKRIKL